METRQARRLRHDDKIKVVRNGREFEAAVAKELYRDDFLGENVVDIVPLKRNISFRFARPDEIKERIRS